MNSTPKEDPPRSRRDIARTLSSVAAISLFAVSLYLCHRTIQVMERAITVLEKADAKVDRAITAAPRVVERGKELLNSAEAERLRAEAKERAATMGGKAKDWLFGSSKKPDADQ